MARWGELWQRGQLTPGTVRLWTAACVSPVDCGERPLEPHERPDAPRRRKLRPIACAECPLKLVEGAAIDAVMTEVAPALEPAQMGCGVADGASVMVSLLRTWAEEEMAVHAEVPQDPLVFAEVRGAGPGERLRPGVQVGMHPRPEEEGADARASRGHAVELRCCHRLAMGGRRVAVVGDDARRVAGQQADAAELLLRAGGGA